MPYRHLEELRSRRQEKIALLLTAENAAGFILAALPAYTLTAGLPFLLRVIVVGAAAALGVAATLDINGQTFYERMIWRVRGVFRLRLYGDTLRPEQFSGVAGAVQADIALPEDGPIQPVLDVLEAIPAAPGEPRSTFARDEAVSIDEDSDANCETAELSDRADSGLGRAGTSPGELGGERAVPHPPAGDLRPVRPPPG